MNNGKTVFSQLSEFLPLHEFRKSVHRYRGDFKVLSFSCLDQFLCMAFAQLTFREGLRDIETCLRTVRPKLYHRGIRGGISRNTLAHANENRDWRIYADFAQVLIKIARELYANEDFGIELKNTVYAFDSTTIDLCLSVFPWAKFRKTKAAVKLHTLLDLRGSIPVVISITNGKISDVDALDDLTFEPGAIYIFDKAYIDFARLYRIHQSLAFFVTRAKSNFVFKRLLTASGQVNRDTGRPDHYGHRFLHAAGLSRETQANPILRYRHKEAFHFSDQQLHAAGNRDREALQVPLESGVVLQMDQTTPAYQGVLRHQRECVEDTNMDRHFCIRSRG